MKDQPRKGTKFVTCERHAWLMNERPRRRAEFFVEGGPAGQAGCRGGKCRLFPGTDLFEKTICTQELALDWTEAVAA